MLLVKTKWKLQKSTLRNSEISFILIILELYITYLLFTAWDLSWYWGGGRKQQSDEYRIMTLLKLEKEKSMSMFAVVDLIHKFSVRKILEFCENEIVIKRILMLRIRCVGWKLRVTQ